MQAGLKKETLPLMQVLVCGSIIVSLAMGIRHGFGLWLWPVTQANNWSRETFSFAMAIQNLSWGFFGIFAGMAADKWGAFRVLIVGSMLYALGLVGMSWVSTPFLFTVFSGVLIGAAQAGTTYAVVYGVIGRNVPAQRRSWAMGVAAAAGSLGQFLMVPLESFLIHQVGAQQTLVLVGVLVLVMIPLAFGLREPARAVFQAGAPAQSIGQALQEAFRYPSFQLLMAGYFVCGFQLAFMGVHLPSYLKDGGLAPDVAAYALGLIGLFNVAGSYAAGWAGQRFPKRYGLSLIYAVRALAIAVFVSVPLSPMSAYVFAAAMGFLWLSTVPLTNAIVAQIFGVAHLSMLSGCVFLSHQVGSFSGVWLAGYLYDQLGSYDIFWQLAMILGIFAACVNMFVRESEIRRVAMA